MDQTADAIKLLLDTGKNMELAGYNEVETDDGRKMLLYFGKEVSNNRAPRPQPLELHTLAAVGNFVNGCKGSDNPLLAARAITVDNEKQVTVYAGVQDVYHDRPVIAIAKPLSDTAFRFDTFMPLETFLISLQAHFKMDDDLKSVINGVCHLKVDKSVTLKDSGITQTAIKRAGLDLAEAVPVPNPVTLRPYRTFPEIEQPQSQFVLRLTEKDEEILCGLWQADGGMWRVDAASGIAAHLDMLINNLTGEDMPDGFPFVDIF